MKDLEDNAAAMRVAEDKMAQMIKELINSNKQLQKLINEIGLSRSITSPVITSVFCIFPDCISIVSITFSIISTALAECCCYTGSKCVNRCTCRAFKTCCC